MGTAKNTTPATANQAELNNSQLKNSLSTKEGVMSNSKSNLNSMVDSNENLNKGLTAEQIAENLYQEVGSNHQDQKDLEEKYDLFGEHIITLKSEISSKQAILDSSKIPGTDGNIVPLTAVVKAKIKTEIKLAKTKTKELEKKQMEVARKLKAIYKHKRDLITKANIKVNAANEKYHNRFSSTIYKSISEFLAKVDNKVLKKYKADLAKVNMEEEERLVISLCQKAPKFLVTKITANEIWKKKYISHVLSELKKIK